jgi:hypothetical protein
MQNVLQPTPIKASGYLHESADVCLANTVCPINSESQENSAIWQNTERYKEGKAVANHEFPFSSFGFFCVGLIPVSP